MQQVGNICKFITVDTHQNVCSSTSSGTFRKQLDRISQNRDKTGGMTLRGY